MAHPRPWLLLLLCQALLVTTRKLIVDTDLFSDVDDVGALLLACTHPRAHLLAVNVNSPSIYTGRAVSSLLGYYNHSSTLLGLIRPFTTATYFDSRVYRHGEYASKVAHHWQKYASLPHGDVSTAPDPVEVYRRVLAKESNVTIASIGFLDNLSALLSSGPDAHSPLSGPQLIKASVAELVVMGGAYPSGHEFNFAGGNASAAAHVVSTWPGRTTFLGFEVGERVLSGGPLSTTWFNADPVRAAYRWFSGCNLPTESWDPLTVLYAVDGLGDMFAYGPRGYNFVYPNGSNEWRTDAEGGKSHRFLTLATESFTAGAVLDDLFMRGALSSIGGCS